MTLTDIISKVTRYAKKIIVTDNSSTAAASITQSGSGAGLSVLANTSDAISVNTTTGTAITIQKNDPSPNSGGSLKLMPSTGGEFVYDGGADGKFLFNNTSPATTKATIFNGANVGINETSPAGRLHVGGVAVFGRIDTAQEGGEIRLSRSSDNLPGWHIDAQGAGNTPFLRIFDGETLTRRVVIDGSNGNVGVGTTSPAARLHVNGSVRLEGIPTFANNAAAIAGGLAVNDVYKIAAGELRIVV